MPPMQKHQQLSAWCKFLSKDDSAAGQNGPLKRSSDAMFDESGAMVSNGYGMDSVPSKRQRYEG